MSAATPIQIGGCSIVAEKQHPYLVDEWTVSGMNGSFAVVKVYSPPDENGHPKPTCESLVRARDDASFVREGWLKREQKRVADYLKGQP